VKRIDENLKALILLIAMAIMAGYYLQSSGAFDDWINTLRNLKKRRL
jgi:hypothetical protein